MRFLLDTAVLLWSLDRSDQLNERAQKTLEGGEDIHLSAASSWEIAIKCGLGKLRLPKPPAQLIPEAMNRLGIRPLPIALSHSLAVTDLPNHHKDPFDRMLIAQARSEGMVLMTADAAFRKYPVEILWCGK
jgi:PIN domain nuclease of toxin-antitoxin system